MPARKKKKAAKPVKRRHLEAVIKIAKNLKAHPGSVLKNVETSDATYVLHLCPRCGVASAKLKKSGDDHWQAIRVAL